MVVKENCYLITGIFPDKIIAGFTRPNLTGCLPSDIYSVFQFQGGELEVSYLNQLHSSQVNVIDKAGVYKGDALFTAVKNNILVVRTADCMPIFFYSSQLDTVGIVHMGWKSAFAGILESIPCDLHSFKVILGVGLRRCC
jgi:hypothetical protein